MTPPEIAAAATGVAAGLAGVVGMGLRARGAGPALVAAGALGVLAALTLTAGLPRSSEVWVAALLHPSLAGLLGLAVLASLPAASRDLPTAAVLGGLGAGALPTAALLLPQAATPAEAGRLAVLCVAAALASPFGGPAQLLLGGASPRYLALAAGPALVGLALAWPRAHRPAGVSARALGPVLGLPVCWLVGPAAGVGVAVLVAIALGGRPERGRLSMWLGWAAAAHLVAATAHVGGVGLYVAFGLDQLPHPLTRYAGALTAGLLTEPFVGAAVLSRGLALDPDATPIVALGLAASPVLPLALAARLHGRGALARALPIAAAMALGGAIVAIVTG